MCYLNTGTCTVFFFFQFVPPRWRWWGLLSIIKSPSFVPNDVLQAADPCCLRTLKPTQCACGAPGALADSVSSDYTVVEMKQRTGLQQLQQQQQYTAVSAISSFSSRNALGGFLCYAVACFLDVRNIKVLANVVPTSISRFLLPVDYYCQ